MRARVKSRDCNWAIRCSRQRKLEWKMRSVPFRGDIQTAVSFRAALVAGLLSRGRCTLCPRIRENDIRTHHYAWALSRRREAGRGKRMNEEERKDEWQYETLSITKSNTGERCPSRSSEK